MSPRAAGLWTAAIVGIADQAHKYWMLHIFDIGSRQPVHVTGFLDLLLVWNRGISYSLLQTGTPAGRWALVIVTALITAFLAWLIWRAGNRLLGLGLGLIVGGAVGNLIDRIVYGAVADFFYLFLDTERWGRLSWYVFNIADVAIVAGAIVLLYESLFAKAPAGVSGPDVVTKSPKTGGK